MAIYWLSVVVVLLWHLSQTEDRQVQVREHHNRMLSVLAAVVPTTFCPGEPFPRACPFQFVPRNHTTPDPHNIVDIGSGGNSHDRSIYTYVPSFSFFRQNAEPLLQALHIKSCERVFNLQKTYVCPHWTL